MTLTTHPHSVSPDVLRWAIFIALVTCSCAVAADGLQPTTGPGGTPVVNNNHGVPVIDIVAPNARGLSHNQFLDYNVAKPGVVLNNALRPGQSQLVGALNANPQFQGQAASTILNEVVSRNASLIEGPQEIFGRAADYILANPNGITLNGGSFINTTRAGLLVGTPDIQDQQIRFLDTLNASGTLQVLEGGQSNREAALELIAPRIDQHGALDARTDLNLTVGRNRIDAQDGQIIQHLPSAPASIDASLFGAMRAGRIRVVSTAEGAGVRVGPSPLSADNGISVRSSGTLHVSGTADERARLRTEQGELALTAAGDLTLDAVEAKAGRIEFTAGNKLTLDAKTRESLQRDHEQWNNKFLFVTTETYNRERTTTDRQQQGTLLHADEGIALQSGDDMRLVAADLRTRGELRLDSAAKLDVEAGIDSQRIEEQVRHRKHLWRGDSDTDRYKETANASQLEGGRIVMTAGDTLKVQGSRLQSQGDTLFKAGQVSVTTTTLQDTGTQRDYRGDLVSGAFFGSRDGNERQGQTVAGSELKVGGDLDIIADQVTVKGSTLSSQGDSVLFSEKGLLAIEADRNRITTTEHERDSKLFGLFGSDQTRTTRQEQAIVSDLNATSDLRLASAEEMRLIGAKATAGKTLQVQAKGDLLIASAQAQTHSETQQVQRGLKASARQTQDARDGKADSRQFEASLGYQVTNTQQQADQTMQTPSELKGATVSLDSGAHLQVDGSRAQATAGTLTAQGAKISLGATHDTVRSTTEKTRSEGGLTVSGGIDRLGSATTGQRRQNTTVENDSTAVRSELLAKGDLTLSTAYLASDAARVEAGGTLQVNAGQIDNRAVEDIKERKQDATDWRAGLGASLEYRDLTRPIERLVQGEEAARFQQASVEDALAAPSIGGDLTVEHIKRLENQRRGYAQVSEFTGASVHVKADRIEDQGTQWRATAGTLKIDAGRHQLKAASDSQSDTLQRLDAGGDLRVDTSTGQDINGRGAGKGGSVDKTQTQLTARPGGLFGQQGVQIQLAGPGLYEGTRVDAGNGAFSAQSTGSLTFAAATDSTSKQSLQLTGNAWLKGGNRPGSTGLEGRGYLDREREQRQSGNAHVAQIDAKGDVILKSGGDLLLEGTRIGSREAPTGEVRLDSDGLLQIKAARNTQTASGGKIGGGLELAAKTGNSKGGALGGHFTHAKLDEDANQAVDARIDTRAEVHMRSRAREDVALHAQGLHVSATRLDLQTPNGGLLLEASGNQDKRSNLDITGGAGLTLSRGELDSRGLYGRIKLDLDKRDNQTWNANTLRADHINLYTQGDARFEGTSLGAGRIQGSVGGDLLLASRKDRIDTLTVGVDARLSQEKNPQSYTNAAKALAGPAAGKVGNKTSSALSQAEPGLSPTFKLDLSHQQCDTVAHQATFKGTDGIALKIGGDAKLVGARLLSANGSVELDAASVTRQTLSGTDYRRDVSIDASNSPVDLGTAIAELAKDKGAAEGDNPLDLGLVRTSGHNRTEQWASHIEQKRR
ncbi:hemagglutinin repeat-containing protein [Pseudomonas guariconensis]|uniref:hemagglutinin repeat-containing protein n=1 Tax=Pseudomonas guariconensis TaxID=1288410 RepID=UPI0011AEF742|nr:hemagglutinin repeat-containing protein [Pseudomonas guariconensis]